MTDLSVIIPARNEMFLARTIQDILANMRGDTEIIATLDGRWADPCVEDHPRVSLVYYPEPIGQRGACNAAARVAQGKWVMKCDAHTAFDEGFDVKMLEAAESHEDWTFAPLMRNLHVFDWVCKNGHRRYQGPSGPCRECGEPTFMDIVWIAKKSPQSTSYCFDSEPHFQYFGEYRKRPYAQGDITETMSLQGSCWMLTREKYFDLNVCDEAWGTWGSQGIEVACKTWLSGGKVMVNHKTWHAHCFRTQGGDFGFPYPIGGKTVSHAKATARRLFFECNWDRQVHPLSWLVEKFWPVPGWSDEDLAKLKANESGRFETTKRDAFEVARDFGALIGVNVRRDVTIKNPKKGIAYYSDCQIDPVILQACQKQLIKAAGNIPIVSATIKKMDFGKKNIHFPSKKRGYLTMFEQIKAALEHSTADIIFFCEHDVLYHPSHFDFTPPDPTKIYYNLNTWKVRWEDGHALHYDCKQTAMLCGYRDILLEHYKKRVEATKKVLEAEGGDTANFRRFIREQGFEPGSHHRHARVDDLESDTWQSEYPNIDIRHDGNLTPNRWRKDQFINQRNTRGWTEAEEVPGWGRVNNDSILSITD